jgi:hypothetical protein
MAADGGLEAVFQSPPASRAAHSDFYRLFFMAARFGFSWREEVPSPSFDDRYVMPRYMRIEAIITTNNTAISFVAHSNSDNVSSLGSSDA